MIAWCIAVPAGAGLIAFLPIPRRARRALLVAAALAHAAVVAATWAGPVSDAWGGLLGLDAAGRLVLSVTSVLFLVVAVYAHGYLGRETRAARPDFQEGFLFSNAPEAAFVGCLLLFLAAMTLVAVSRHFGMLWVAIEATTLVSAPLIYFHRHHRSLEATWKYLMICSVGLALALLGTFCMAIAATRADGSTTPLLIDDLLRQGAGLQPEWLRLAFILMLVGYGAKMGLAPLHTWLPDAHSESPSAVSALLSGALLNCAFLGIARACQVLAAAGLAPFTSPLLVVLGLLSMATAAVFLIAQPDYKRMLAYSSVEHMGILALGLGLGGRAAYGALLHLVGHAFAKGMLFLLAGNILAAYRTKAAREVRGAARRLPVSGRLWIAGLLAITGTPPFALFLSEFLIARAAFEAGRHVVGALFLGLLFWIFAAMARGMLAMAQGPPPAETGPARREAVLAFAPPAALGAAALLFGLFIPAPLDALLRAAAAALGGPVIAAVGP